MNVLVLTGAGISAESGIPTFRGPDGLWEGHRVEDVATPEAFERHPQRVHRFYNLRRAQLRDPAVQPNAAHIALADFERAWRETHRGDFLLVTQNIDPLHQRAGSENVLAMHGECLKARCSLTGDVFDWPGDLFVDTPHPDDPDDERLRGALRPHVVWFGEMPLGLERIAAAAAAADIFIAIGTSGMVYPAAGIVAETPPHCRRIEINLDATPASSAFEQTHRGPATQLVPKVLAEINAGR